MKILFVIPYMFVPPDSGNKNLLYNLLKYMVVKEDCNLVLLVDDASDVAAIEATLRREFPTVGRIVIFPKPRGFSLLLAMLKALSHGYHFALGRYSNRDLADWLITRMKQDIYDMIHFDMVHVASYRKFCKDVPTLLVASDAYSLAARNAGLISRSIKTRLSMLIESRLLRHFERNEYPQFNVVCTVSEVDAKYLQAVAPTAVIRTIGIALDPEFSERKIAHFSLMPAKKILCTGNLNHEIIADGIIEFVQRNLTYIRKLHPDVKVTILGKNPTVKLKQCIDETAGVEHIDYVQNYADFLDQDWVYVYPQLCGTGLQTKVLQAMALGLPVVGYEVSFGGLSVESGTHCFICNNSNDMSNYVLRLVGDVDLRREIGLSAARHVRENFSIKRVGSHMVSLYDEAILLRNVD